MYVPDYPADMIYYQPGVYCTYGIGLPVGLWLGYDWDWRGHNLLSWGPGRARPGNWWHQSPRQRHDYISEHPAPAWHEGRGLAVAASRWDRGFAQPEVYRSFAQPALPRAPGPRVASVRPAENFRPAAAPAGRAAAPIEQRAFAPSESAGGVFGGFQSGRQTQESSFRGQASRSGIAPSFSASESRGGGGGGERRGR
jgi:hypothetical protein